VIVAVSGWCREPVGLSVRRLINTTTIDSHTPRRVKVLFLEGGGGWSTFLCSQSGDDSQEDLAKFGYKLISKVKILKILVYLFLATLLNHV
jgi:hypothetical protein